MLSNKDQQGTSFAIAGRSSPGCLRRIPVYAQWRKTTQPALLVLAYAAVQLNRISRTSASAANISAEADFLIAIIAKTMEASYTLEKEYRLATSVTGLSPKALSHKPRHDKLPISLRILQARSALSPSFDVHQPYDSQGRVTSYCSPESVGISPAYIRSRQSSAIGITALCLSAVQVNRVATTW